MFWCFIMFRTRKIYKQLVNWRLKMQSYSFKMFFFFILLDDLFILARIELQKLSKYWKTEENYCISLWLWAKIYLIDALNVCRFEPKESSVFFYLSTLNLDDGNRTNGILTQNYTSRWFERKKYELRSRNIFATTISRGIYIHIGFWRAISFVFIQLTAGIRLNFKNTRCAVNL